MAVRSSRAVRSIDARLEAVTRLGLVPSRSGGIWSGCNNCRNVLDSENGGSPGILSNWLPVMAVGWSGRPRSVAFALLPRDVLVAAETRGGGVSVCVSTRS